MFNQSGFASSILLTMSAVFLLTISPLNAQQVQLMGDGELWSFFRGITEPPGSPGAWRGPGYDDSAWASGVPPLGYGDGDDVTLLSDMRGMYSSVYARRRFFAGALLREGTAIASGASACAPGALPVLDHLWLTVDYDDGFVAYLNGVEVARRGLGEQGTFVPHDALASDHEAGALERIDITPFLKFLKPGENVLALQGHNSSLFSSDLTLTATLQATGPIELTRYPYLQRPAEGEVTIAWKTAAPGVGSVLYNAVGAVMGGGLLSPRVVSEPAPATLHVVELSGLEPDTLYGYVVAMDGKPLTGGDVFRTLGGSASESISFNAVGDSGVDTGLTRAVRSRWLATGATLGLRLGDLAYDSGTDQEFQDHYFAVYRDFLRRGFDMTTIGNHESYTNAAQPYLDNLFLPSGGTERYYAFEAGPALFISLDVETSDYGPGSTQRDWLEKTLAASARPWKFAFMHDGPYSCSLVHGSNFAARESFSPLFERYGIDVVFAGHDHGYERSRPVLDFMPEGKPVRYIVSGGGGRSLYPWRTDCPWTAVAASTDEIVNVSVNGPCLTLRAIRPDGSMVDADSFCKPLVPPASSPPDAD